MMQYLVLSSVLLAAALHLPQVEAGSVEFLPIGSLFGNDGGAVPERLLRRTDAVNATTAIPPFRRGPSQQERELERKARRQRQRARNARAKESIKHMRPDKLEKLSEEEVNAIMKDKDEPFLRRLGWGSKKAQSIEYLDSGEDYDMWSQAYRMLGGFIDCDHHKDQGGSHDEGGGGQDGNGKCSRWMMWASVS